ncbi:receptor-like protein 34 [Malania oleifera]|uniref:receptor-like protein 34 n=1 Tax=Malania oleifera TaxID=397392 RepID=UPI0025ADA69B|nr:receptor-like protein 34 [Malania oleifera]
MKSCWLLEDLLAEKRSREAVAAAALEDLAEVGIKWNSPVLAASGWCVGWWLAAEDEARAVASEWSPRMGSGSEETASDESHSVPRCLMRQVLREIGRSVRRRDGGIVIYNDASLKVLGCVLMQQGWLSSLSSIVSLDLSYNRIPGLLPALLRNLTTLRFLNLAYNQFNSAIPKWLYDMTSLQILDLKYNNFQGSISGAFANLTSLTELQLSSNYFEGRIPRSLGNLCNLRILGLSLNQLSGDISEFFGDHSSISCIKEMLESLNFGLNHLSGQLPNHLGEFKSLTILDIFSNSISGPIPVSIGKLSSLRRLDISSNLFNGSIPETLGSLSKLEGVFISNNSFEDIVSEVHFANLTRLKYFVADSNQLTLKISHNWIPPFQLREISMSSSDGGPQLFPAWLQT